MAKRKWSEDNQQLAYRCEKCGLGYKAIPEGGRCMDKDEDGFRCGGTVKRK